MPLTAHRKYRMFTNSKRDDDVKHLEIASSVRGYFSKMLKIDRCQDSGTKLGVFSEILSE